MCCRYFVRIVMDKTKLSKLDIEEAYQFVAETMNLPDVASALKFRRRNRLVLMQTEVAVQLL